MSILEVSNVSKSFGGVKANVDVSMSVEKGTIVGLIGPNGSGKTTLFNSIVGTYPIDQGSIKFDGLNKPKNVYTSSEEKIGKDGILRAEYRLIFLKLKNNGKMSSLNELKPLIAHELAHTAANHVTWRDDDHGNVFNKNYNIIYKHI